MTTKQKRIVIVSLVVLAGLVIFSLMGYAGNLEPSAPPGPTMRTLEEVYTKTVWRMLDKNFVEWPGNPRFAVCDDGTSGDFSDDMVLDKETGLIWARDANLPGEEKLWEEAVSFCRNLVLGNRKGWRLATVEELGSLVDPSNSWPSLPSGHPFINVQFTVLNKAYWSSTTNEVASGAAWAIRMFNGGTSSWWWKADANMYVWPVRGGNGYASGNW